MRFPGALWIGGAVRPSLAVVGAAILLVAGLAVSAYQDRLHRAERTSEVLVQGRILASGIAAALSSGDVRRAGEYVNAMKINPGIKAVAVYGSRGAFVAGFSRAGGAVPSSISLQSLLPPGDRLTLYLPVTLDGARLGTVYIRAIEEPAKRRLTRYAAIMLLTVMAALLVAVLSTSQRALRRANQELEERAVALARMNHKLEREMEERARAEEALRYSQKMEAVGQLSGGVAHDFNNILTIIKGNLHLLQKRIAEGRPDTQRYLDSANQSLDRAAQLTRRLLAFSRRQPLSPGPVGLSDLVRGMQEMVAHAAGEAVRIEWRLAARWKTVCDANQMENVVLNLTINARDAMPAGGGLLIETRDVHLDPRHAPSGLPSGDYVELRVSDTGVGMSEEVLSRAVDPFFTTKPQGHGTGLGLSTAFAFIRQSNGHMRIESAPGRGTLVAILMPRHMAQAEVDA